MVEPTFRQELQCIRDVDHLRYIIAMQVWFHQWKQEYGSWPSLPACGFQFGALAMATMKTWVVSVTSEVKMTLGERQVLQVLTTLQYLAEMGPKSLPPSQCVRSIMQQAGISFMSHAVLGYAMSIWSRSTSVKTDISCTNISLLPCSVGLAGDMLQPYNQLWLGDYESAMGEMTLDSASSTRAVELDLETMEKNSEADAQEDGVDKE